MKKLLSRRTVLRGGGGIALSLPLLEAMGLGCTQSSGARAGDLATTTAAATNGPPKRFILFFSPDGINPPTWWPTGSGTNFNLSQSLQPLAAHKQDLVVLRGVTMRSANNDPMAIDAGHQKPMGHLTTGATLIQSGGQPMGGGISIDQAIANTLTAPGLVKSIHYGIDAYGYSAVMNYLSYSAAAKPVDPEQDPIAGLNSLFVGGTGTPDATAKLYAERRSVLDAVAGDLSSLQTKVSGSDLQRIQQHLESIRDVETRMAPTAATQSCTRPIVSNASKQVRGRAFIDMMVAAFACDRTRVANLQWGRSTTDVTWSWINGSGDVHPLSHDITPMTAFNTYFAGEMAYMIERLKATPEGTAGGTLFDSTAIVWLTNHAEPHSYEVPFVMASGKNIPLPKGKYILGGPQTHQNFYVSLLNAFGNPTNVFGNAATGTGPLTALV